MTNTGDAILRAVLLAPEDEFTRGVYCDWLEDQGRSEEAEALRGGKMILDDADRMAAMALTGCRFVPGSPDKRFVREVSEGVANDDIDRLTPKQRRYLWRLVWRYRRQIRARSIDRPLLDKEYLIRVAAFLTGMEAT